MSDSSFQPCFDPCLALMARHADAIIGWRGATALRQADFLQRIAAWQALLATQSAQDFALYQSDTLEFGAALLAAWQCGKTIWLSADTLPTTCQTMAHSVAGFLGEFPAEYAPIQPAPASPLAPAALHALNALNPQAMALVVHTSGSTGLAQAIPKRMAQILNEIATLETVFGARLGDAEIIATVSHQHIYGLLFKLLWPLAAGRAIHALSLNYPEQLALTLAERPCALIASPAHLKRLPEHINWQGAARQTRAIFSSGGMLPGEVAHAVANLLGQAPIEVYGSSETGGIAWRQRQLARQESWQALPRVAWRIADDGTLEVQSPHLPDASWMRLADLAQDCGDQRFLLLGRTDRIVKIEEKRISIDAMEAALLASGLVLEVRIVLHSGQSSSQSGQPDQAARAANVRQRLAAFVVASGAGKAMLAAGGKAALNQALRQVLARVVEAIALPRHWRYLDQMPINAQGKTTQAQLLALLDHATPASDLRPRMPQVQLLEQTEQRLVFEVTVPATLFYLDGHFSRVPVLPGVVQVDWAIHYARQYFHLAGPFRAIHNLKFQNIIRAESPVQLELIHDVQKGALQFRYFSDAGQHASGRILFGPAMIPTT